MFQGDCDLCRRTGASRYNTSSRTLVIFENCCMVGLHKFEDGDGMNSASVVHCLVGIFVDSAKELSSTYQTKPRCHWMPWLPTTILKGSVGPYWWPDPSKPDGLPYIRKDGHKNPDRGKIGDSGQSARFVGDARSL